jgi:protein-tyrosine-phosphatase/glycosyltransferase involved in cell wall biosynthesis
MRPTVSVIIPTYNRPHLLVQAIESVRRQSVAGIEIVVVDDGSERPVEPAIPTHDELLRVLRQENRGLNAARNVGLAAARGEFIALLDDDDLWLPWKTEIQVAAMRRFPEAAFIFSDFTIFDAQGIKAQRGLTTWNDFPASWQIGRQSDGSARDMGLPLPSDGSDYRVMIGNIYRQSLHEPYVLPSTALVRRAAISGSAPFPAYNTHCGDWQFFALLAQSASCIFLTVPTAMNRSHDDAVRLTRKSPLIRMRDRLNLINDVWRSDKKFMDAHGVEVEKVEGELFSKMALFCLFEDRLQEARDYLSRWRSLPSATLGAKGLVLLLAAHLPWGPMLLRWLREMNDDRRLRSILKRIKCYLVDRWWQLRGRSLWNPPLPARAASIVFVCKGNICRSAFAHYFTLKELGSGGEEALRVFSAGLQARQGTSSPAMAIEAAKDFGIDLQPHRAGPLTEEMVAAADMLIAMEPGQIGEMRRRYPHKRRNIFLLPLFADGWDHKYFGWRRYHIQDPYGKGREAFVESFGRVKESVDGLIGKLKN